MKTCLKALGVMLSRVFIGFPKVQSVSEHAPWKINMEPINGCLEDDCSFQTGDFQVPC